MKFYKTSKVLTYALVALFAAAFTGVSFGQNRLQKEHFEQEAAKLVPGARYVLEGLNTPFPAYVKFREDKAVPYATFFEWLRENLNVQPETGFQLLKEEKDGFGFTIYRFSQTYKGVPVDLGMLRVQVKDGNVVSFNGEIEPLPKLASTPALDEAEALRHALDFVGAKSYLWESPFWEEEIKRKEKNANATWFPKGELNWSKPAPDAAGKQGGFRLAWRFDIYTNGGSPSQRVLVDAVSGGIVNSIPLESNCDPTTVNTIWNGNQGINTEKFTGTDWRLRDDCQNAEIWIRDWGSTTTSSSPNEIQNNTNTWTTMNEVFGGSVLWAARESFLYYLNVHGRSSYDNSNGDVTGYINAVFDCSPPAGCTNTDNASMSFSGGNMKVGLGAAGTLANSWGTLDIIGHEYTHAVTGSSSDLNYQGESGALNESFSDIFGEAIERSTTGANDWLVGDNRTNGAIRSLQNPNANNDPDTYNGTNWTNTCGGCGDNGGVHTNSGVQNFWFFLLTSGGMTFNDNSDFYGVSGIGFDNAAAIAFRNNTVKLNSGSNYAGARAGAIEAAEDLFGDCSNEVIQVKNAWFAVGVGDPGMPVFNASYVELDACSSDAFNISLQTKRIANMVTPDYTWTVNYNGLTGGGGNCGGGCGLLISETLTNNTPTAKTAIYTVTPTFDGCDGPSFTISKTVHPRPVGANSTESVLCSGDAFSIDLQSKITNGVLADFTWTVDYNGLEGGNGAGSGDFINETLVNNTGATASAVYTVNTEDEVGNCRGNTFTVTVDVPPVLSISAGENQTVYYGYPPAACATLSWSDAMGGTPPYTYEWSTGETSQEIEVCPIVTTTYTIVITDANGCTASDDVMVCVIDVRCGNNLNKVEICHHPDGNSNTLCVGLPAVAAHLAHGDMLAACGTDHNCPPAAMLIIPPISFDEMQSGDLSVMPNPFSQSATVAFSSAAEGNVIIKLLDVTGKEIMELFNGQVEAEVMYEVEVDARDLTPGMNYCVMLRADGTVAARKVILEK